jgi:hypothetical protein
MVETIVENLPVDAITEALNFMRSIDGEIPMELFRWVHAGCNKVNTKLEITDSKRTDPSTGESLSVFNQTLFCPEHQVSSTTELSTGI